MSAKPSLSDIQKLLWELVFPFYQIERDLYLPVQNHRNENDAEHSWSLAFLAIALAPEEIDPKLDVGKLTMFAVLHDLVEVYAGDTSVWAEQAEHNTKTDREERAARKIVHEFKVFPNIGKTIEEYESKKSEEARFIWALDKFLALLILHEDKGYYYHKNKIAKARFDKQFITHRKKAHAHPQVKVYYEQVRDLFDSHPEYFYSATQSSKNIR